MIEPTGRARRRIAAAVLFLCCALRVARATADSPPAVCADAPPNVAAGDDPPPAASDPPIPPSPRPRRLFDAHTTELFLGMSFLVTPVGGYLQWWKRDEWQRFHFAHEGFFGRNTYAGGSDKTSHFYYGTLGEEALSSAYGKLGHPPAEARALALANTALSSLVVEVGDALTSYGFSWEDATVGTAGAAAESLVLARGLDDTIGFRFGHFPLHRAAGESAPGPPHRAPPSAALLEAAAQPLATRVTIGTGYSYEIYTADVKLAGLLPRLRAKPGIARFFLLSATYHVYGYPELAAPLRQRNVGLELGVSFPEILRALGIRDATWWGKPVLLFFEHYRVPYSAAGIRYDLNARRWHGFDFGDRP